MTHSHRSNAPSRPRSRTLPALLVAGVMALAGACSRSNEGAAGVGADPLEAGTVEVRKLLAAMPADVRRRLVDDPGLLEQTVRAELVRNVMLAEARAARIEVDPKFVERIARLRDEALVQAWLERQARVADDFPREDDLRIAFEANAAALAPAARFRVAQIFISAPNGVEPARLAKALSKAAEVGNRIPGGDFAALARQYSEHAESAQRGGEVGVLPADQMLPEIVATVSNLAVGETAGPIKTSQGLHYVKLLERESAPPPSFDEARARLSDALRTQRARDLEQIYLAGINARVADTAKEIVGGETGKLPEDVPR